VKLAHISGTKKEYLKVKTDELETYSKTKIIRLIQGHQWLKNGLPA
jgi:hypothetical protein